MSPGFASDFRTIELKVDWMTTLNVSRAFMNLCFASLRDLLAISILSIAGVQCASARITRIVITTV